MTTKNETTQISMMLPSETYLKIPMLAAQKTLETGLKVHNKDVVADAIEFYYENKNLSK